MKLFVLVIAAVATEIESHWSEPSDSSKTIKICIWFYTKIVKVKVYSRFFNDCASNLRLKDVTPIVPTSRDWHSEKIRV